MSYASERFKTAAIAAIVQYINDNYGIVNVHDYTQLKQLFADLADAIPAEMKRVADGIRVGICIKAKKETVCKVCNEMIFPGQPAKLITGVWQKEVELWVHSGCHDSDFYLWQFVQRYSDDVRRIG